MVTVRTINPSRIACVMKIINRTVEPHGLMIGHVSAGGVVDAAAEPVGSFPQVWLSGNGTPQIVVRECGFGSITNLVKEVRWQRLDEPDTDRFSDHSGYEGLVPVDVQTPDLPYQRRPRGTVAGRSQFSCDRLQPIDEQEQYVGLAFTGRMGCISPCLLYTSDAADD